MISTLRPRKPYEVLVKHNGGWRTDTYTYSRREAVDRRRFLLRHGLIGVRVVDLDGRAVYDE